MRRKGVRKFDTTRRGRLVWLAAGFTIIAVACSSDPAEVEVGNPAAVPGDATEAHTGTVWLLESIDGEPIDGFSSISFFANRTTIRDDCTTATINFDGPGSLVVESADRLSNLCHMVWTSIFETGRPTEAEFGENLVMRGGEHTLVATHFESFSQTGGPSGPVMRHLEPVGFEGEGALIAGLIEIEGDCLYITSEIETWRYPVVWPGQTSWDSENQRVRLPNGESVGHGDAINGGGGYHDLDQVRDVAGDAAADLATECLDSESREIAVINNYPDAVAGGVPSTDTPTDGQPDDITDLEGDWIVDKLTVDGANVELDAFSPITLTINAESIRGQAACNNYSGTIDWSIAGGTGRFVVSDVAQSDGGCQPAAMDVDTSFFNTLQAVDSFEAADALYVAKAGIATNFRLVRAERG